MFVPYTSESQYLVARVCAELCWKQRFGIQDLAAMI